MTNHASPKSKQSLQSKKNRAKKKSKKFIYATLGVIIICVGFYYAIHRLRNQEGTQSDDSLTNDTSSTKDDSSTKTGNEEKNIKSNESRPRFKVKAKDLSEEKNNKEK